MQLHSINIRHPSSMDEQTVINFLFFTHLYFLQLLTRASSRYSVSYYQRNVVCAF